MLGVIIQIQKILHLSNFVLVDFLRKQKENYVENEVTPLIEDP